MPRRSPWLVALFVLLLSTTYAAPAVALSPAAPHFCQCTEYIARKYGLGTSYQDAWTFSSLLLSRGFREVQSPEFGALVVFNRGYFSGEPAFSAGHVALFRGFTPGGWVLRGANQQPWDPPAPSDEWFDCSNVTDTVFRVPPRGTARFFMPPAAAPPYVAPTLPSLALDFVYDSQSAFLNLAPGQTATLWLRVKNTGLASWVRGGVNELRLGTSQWLDRVSRLFGGGDGWFGPSRVLLQQSYVPPGSYGTFSFLVAAPAQPGRYREYFRPVVDGVSWLRDDGIYWDIVVQPATSTQPPVRTAPPQVVLPASAPTLSSPGNGSGFAQTTQVVLSWNRASNAVAYKVELWGGPYSLMTPCNWQTGTSCWIGQMWPGTMYWHVKARNSAGQESDWSSTWSFAIGAASAPSPTPTYTGPPRPPYAPSFPGQTVSYGGNTFRSDDGINWTFLWADKPTDCSTSSDGVILYRDRDYSPNGGCLFVTSDVSDLKPLGYDGGVSSIRFVGSYVGRYQVLVYRQANYQDLCTTYTADTSDLRSCAGISMSIQIRPWAAPTPVPTQPGATLVGNIASLATLSNPSATAAVDGNLSTEWIPGHKFNGQPLTLSWPQPVEIHRVVVWDRAQSGSDNNQINNMNVRFSDGSQLSAMDMTSGGPRCFDVTFGARTVTSVTLEPYDASGTNGLKEVEIWATTGSQYSNNSCVMKFNR